MQTEFNKGFEFREYFMQLLVAYRSFFLSVEHTCSHAPGLHHIILIGLFYVSITWSVISLLLALLNIYGQLQLGFLFVNGSYIFLCLVLILYMILRY